MISSRVVIVPNQFAESRSHADDLLVHRHLRGPVRRPPRTTTRRRPDLPVRRGARPPADPVPYLPRSRALAPPQPDARRQPPPHRRVPDRRAPGGRDPMSHHAPTLATAAYPENRSAQHFTRLLPTCAPG